MAQLADEIAQIYLLLFPCLSLFINDLQTGQIAPSTRSFYLSYRMRRLQAVFVLILYLAALLGLSTHRTNNGCTNYYLVQMASSFK